MNGRVARKIVDRARRERGVYSDSTLSHAQRRALGLRLPPFAAGARVRITLGDDNGKPGTIRSVSPFGTLRVELDGETTIDANGAPFQGRYVPEAVEAV